MIGLITLAVLGAYVVSCTLSWFFRAHFAPQVLHIVVKQGWFWGALRFLYKVATFGKRDFYDYYTTLGNVCAVPIGATFPPEKARHEGVHADQCAAFGWGFVWLGFPFFVILYGLLPLPVGLAWFRWRFERAAYVAEGVPIEQIRDKVGGSAYLWCWPRFLMR